MYKCLEMQNIWPYYMYNIKSWSFSYKDVKDFINPKPPPLHAS